MLTSINLIGKGGGTKMNLLRKYIRGLLNEEDVRAMGQCFPFAFQKAKDWIDQLILKALFLISSRV